MNKFLLSLLLCAPFASGIASETDLDDQSPERKYVIALYELSPEMGLIISDISSVRKHNCNDTMSIKRMKNTLVNDSFVTDTLKKHAADPSYMDSAEYRALLDQTYSQCS